ncbi:MAG: ABC transporter ATP-binding protein [Spirochaetia bacterium]|nr:ABC transporter ATP-binding protein [Spirochaetia bacterium]
MKGTNMSRIAWIWRIWRERPALIALLFLLTLLSSAVAVTYPFLSKLLLDALQASLETGAAARGEAMDEIDRIVLLFLAVGAAGLVAGLFPGIRGLTNNVFEHLIRTKYFARVMAKDHRFFAAFRSGDVVTRLTDDLYDFPKLSWFLCSGIFRAVESISKVAFCLGAMLLIHPRLTLWSVLPLPAMIAVFWITQDRIYDTFRRNQEAISDINSQLELSFSGARVIKAYACEPKYVRFFDRALDKRFSTELAVIKLETVLHLIYQYIDLVAQIGIVFAGGILAARGEITIGTFYAFYNYLGMLVYPILDVPQLFVSGKRAFVNIDRLEEMDAYPEPAPPANPVRVRSVDSVEARGLSFSYPGREEKALDSVDFGLRKGERVCVVGPVGSGKTTLVRALAGLVDPDSGVVEVNGTALRELDASSWRAVVGYVPQEALLFSGTIRENVDLGSDAPCDATFRDAVEAAQMAGEIDAMPEKDSTRVGQRGVSLSGGQKQRVAIARAIARKPALLLLDDITASLDAANEERLMSRLREISADMAVLMVSHRMSSLRYADRVVYLEGGRIVASGRHEDLLSNAAYAAFIAEHLRGAGA